MTPTAEIRTVHDRPHLVKAALEPDNTTEMTTRVEDETVTTTITRETVAGLRATVDDYVVNLRVAERVAQSTNEPMEGQSSSTNDTQ